MPIVSARCQNPISIFGSVKTDAQRRQEAVECAVNGAQPANPVRPYAREMTVEPADQGRFRYIQRRVNVGSVELVLGFVLDSPYVQRLA